MIDLVRAQAVACEAADAARAIIQEGYRLGSAVQEKSDGSPVTETDRRAERAIREVLLGAFPEHAVLGEELGQDGDDKSLRWVIDPIDGTIAFVHRIPTAASLIALCEGDEPLVAVVDLPALGRRLTAIRGQGAWEGDRRLAVGSEFDPQASIVSHGDRYTFEMAGYLNFYRALEGQSRLFRSYTDAFGHCLTATGASALMVDAAMEPWDLAAPSLLLREAGAAVQLYPDRRSPERRLLIAGTPGAVAWASELLSMSSNQVVSS